MQPVPRSVNLPITGQVHNNIGVRLWQLNTALENLFQVS